MTALDDALDRLRSVDTLAAAGLDPASPLGEELDASGLGFVALGGPLEARWHQALGELGECVRQLDGGAPVLNEGGVYPGAWIESTGTINAELLARFAPSIARDTHLLFAAHQRDDGMIPYKVTADGPGFSQIQIVTPLARTVWNQYLLAGRDPDYLRTMYDAMVRFDAWLARYRDTLGTGGVEAFCTFDTGHDLSPRFWFAPDRGFEADARRVDPLHPTLPMVAPDLTANVACQRGYLALFAEELGLPSAEVEGWRSAAAASVEALLTQCFDADDSFFYDRDRNGVAVRVQSDVLLRVLACEIGDSALFGESLERYLLNSRKFGAHYGFTSLALDDPRFDHDYGRNSWGGPVNFLSLIRAPHAFEYHGRVAELAFASTPVLAAVAVADRFPQCLDPWTGSPGFTSVYSPSILWFLDTVERMSGILPRPEGTLWFTGLAPTRLDHGAASVAVAHRRRVDGVLVESACDDARTVVLRDGAEWATFPRGWRLVTDRAGTPRAVVGVAPRAVAGELVHGGGSLALTLEPNERVTLDGMRVAARESVGYTPPRAG
ncbi:hypothetical protein SCB71_01325 [Herbiconiux sp. KACC 21604]|uniref:MGH1-like glycoside hydrolase domain-containing protein n=1 Tax=unclassified Herbiconiux TaxID=2618217 RepID=UPI00149134D6|nr:hypothetical protein [Herbiconiux sp. SALV-R1]QJU55705.1 hypothetical protein HL652_20180 [Herbiconiux sp. SALV-R1]WPO86909.1 hypothetical protein SCB71_01325 [Herbiconiux sp. KACC 21604]